MTIEERGSGKIKFLVDRTTGRLWGYKADDGTDVPFASAAVESLRLYGDTPPIIALGFDYLTTYAASGGQPPYAYSINGSLPTGLALDSGTGVLSGKVTRAGTFSFAPTVTDANGAVASQPPVTIQVTGGRPALTLNGVPQPNATVGAVYSVPFAAVGGMGPYHYAITGVLPAGLSFDGDTGLLYGTPTAPGVTTGITVSVTDSDDPPTTATVGPFGITVVTDGASPPPAGADTRPRFFVAPSNANVSGTQAYLDGATRFGLNGGRTGSFSLTTTAGNYGWFAALASAGAPVFTSASAPGFPGGWQSAGTFSDGASTWQLWRQEYQNVNPTAETWTVS